jgi:Cdc6-like AAA superfamily ATPase
MNMTRQFSLALDALAELKSTKPDSTHHLRPIPAAPNLGNVLSEIGSLPAEALFLGIAADGLPVLLNLYDSHPGALLITGDPGAGKTAYLQLIVRAIQQTHRPGDVQFGVITSHVDEWKKVPLTEHCVGIFPTLHHGAKDFVFSLTEWAHVNKSKQSVLLLIDDLEAIASLDVDVLQNLRWLLAHGPGRRVHPIVTINAERYGQVLSWIPVFRTRIFGRIRNERIAEALGGDQMSVFDRLEAGIQFSLRENGNWLRFWAPGI